MDWASHGGVISKLPAHVLVILGHLAREGTPDLAGRAKPSGVEGSRGSTVMRGNGTLPTWRGRLSLSFRAVKRCSTARFFLALGVPTARHAGFMPMRVWARTQAVSSSSYLPM